MELSVLIIDDEKEARDLLANLLLKISNNRIIGSFETAIDAYPTILNETPDILLLDIRIADENGIEFAQQLQKLNLKTKIIFVTAYNEFTIDAIRAHAFDYLLKHVSVQQLKESLNRYRTERENRKDPLNLLCQRYPLTERELDVIRELTNGKTLKEVADTLNISNFTAKTHRQNIYRKLNVNNICELMNLAFVG